MFARLLNPLCEPFIYALYLVRMRHLFFTHSARTAFNYGSLTCLLCLERHLPICLYFTDNWERSMMSNDLPPALVSSPGVRAKKITDNIFGMLSSPSTFFRAGNRISQSGAIHDVQ
jgi:hypothetical protein